MSLINYFNNTIKNYNNSLTEVEFEKSNDFKLIHKTNIKIFHNYSSSSSAAKRTFYTNIPSNFIYRLEFFNIQRQNFFLFNKNYAYILNKESFNVCDLDLKEISFSSINKSSIFLKNTLISKNYNLTKIFKDYNKPKIIVVKDDNEEDHEVIILPNFFYLNPNNKLFYQNIFFDKMDCFFELLEKETLNELDEKLANYNFKKKFKKKFIRKFIKNKKILIKKYLLIKDFKKKLVNHKKLLLEKKKKIYFFKLKKKKNNKIKYNLYSSRIDSEVNSNSFIKIYKTKKNFINKVLLHNVYKKKFYKNFTKKKIYKKILKKFKLNYKKISLTFKHKSIINKLQMSFSTRKPRHTINNTVKPTIIRDYSCLNDKTFHLNSKSMKILKEEALKSNHKINKSKYIQNIKNLQVDLYNEEEKKRQWKKKKK